jgi:3-hydroxybutyryl-CoA dehydratase
MNLLNWQIINMNYTVGQKASFSRTINETDILKFSEISGDFNPIHIDETYAATTRFGKRIAHGTLIASYIGTVLGTSFPGCGTILISQYLEYLHPVSINDIITINLEIIQIATEKRRLKIQTTVSNQDNIIVIDGYCFVKPPLAI